MGVPEIFQVRFFVLSVAGFSVPCAAIPALKLFNQISRMEKI